MQRPAKPCTPVRFRLPPPVSCKRVVLRQQCGPPDGPPAFLDRVGCDARVAELVDAADLKSAGASRAGSIPAPGTPIAEFSTGMSMIEPEKPPQDPDLARWARELGVSYEELASTLNYAGPTFKD